MNEASIAIAASSREWALGLHRFVADHGGARVRVRVMHPEDAYDEGYDVLVIDDITSFLSAHFVQQVQRLDRRVLGVFEEAAGEQRLRSLGVDSVISTSAPPEDFVGSIMGLAAQRHMDEEFDELVAELRPPKPRRSKRASIVAVAGAGGGTGATEVSIALANEIARRFWNTVLIDADDVAPAIAQRLDLPLHPNYLTALDWLQSRTGPIEQVLIRHPAGFELLAGLPNPRDWSEVRAGDAVDVLAELALGADVEVVNLSFLIEQPLHDQRLGGRFGLTRLMLPTADAVLLVCSPSPTGVARTVDWLGDVHRIVEPGDVHLVVNEFDDGLFARGEIEQELRRVSTPSSLTFLPRDRRVSRAAWEGVMVPRGPFMKAIAKLADQLMPAQVRA